MLDHYTDCYRFELVIDHNCRKGKATEKDTYYEKVYDFSADVAWKSWLTSTNHELKSFRNCREHGRVDYNNQRKFCFMWVSLVNLLNNKMFCFELDERHCSELIYNFICSECLLTSGKVAINVASLKTIQAIVLCDNFWFVDKLLVTKVGSVISELVHKKRYQRNFQCHIVSVTDCISPI